jgi:hypothetical protein
MLPSSTLPRLATRFGFLIAIAMEVLSEDRQTTS